MRVVTIKVVEERERGGEKGRRGDGGVYESAGTALTAGHAKITCTGRLLGEGEGESDELS